MTRKKIKDMKWGGVGTKEIGSTMINLSQS